jgi:glycosyltransferase involved in cell wall biosynthesis
MAELPLISIVIPTYNRPQTLQSCLQALTQLQYPRERFEVIVVDDGSSMSLAPIVQPFQSQLSLIFLQQQNSGPATARNTGAKAAQGDYLAFTDDDCAPAPDWLLAFVQQYEQSPTAFLGGKTLNKLPRNLYAAAHQSLIDYLYSYYNAHPQAARFFASNNFMLPASLFHQLGGFDTTFPLAAGEDRELCDRWLSQGYLMFYVPDAILYHSHPMTLRGFWRQHFNYGQGAFHFHCLRAQRGQSRITVEPLSFYYNLLCFPLRQFPSHRSIPLFLLFVLSQVANTLGFCWRRFCSHDP